MIKVLIIFVCQLIPVSVFAEIYKTYDENGRVVFTQIPPSKDAKEYKASKGNPVESTPSANTSRLEEQKKYLDYLTQERLERKETHEQKKIEKAEQEARCHSARAQIEDLNQAGSRYYELDEEGNRVVLDYEKIEMQTSQLKDYVNRHCNGIK